MKHLALFLCLLWLVPVCGLCETILWEDEAGQVILGDDGNVSIQLLGGHKGGGAVLYGPDRQEIERFIPPEENGFVYEIEEFIRGVREGRLESDVIPHRDTLLCMELFDLCDRENPQEK